MKLAFSNPYFVVQSSRSMWQHLVQHYRPVEATEIMNEIEKMIDRANEAEHDDRRYYLSMKEIGAL